MIRKENYFFATLIDIVPVLEDVEAQINLKYIEAGTFADNERPVFSSFRELPELGYSVSGDNMLNSRYLVFRSDSEILVAPIKQRNGTTSYSVDGWTNLDTIVFVPGGLHKASGGVIEGRITLNSGTEVSVELFVLFLKALRRRFRSVRGNFVGDEAYSILESGGRLTQRIRASTGYDLRK